MQGMTRSWYEALANALEKEKGAVLQLATVGTPNRPHVRSVTQRAFLTASAYPSLPLILSTTDVRTPKVAQVAANDTVEAVYWTPSTQEQFRITGRASVVPRGGCHPGAHPEPTGVVHDALAKEGFDWEAERVAMFDRMSGRMKATWCRPAPGTPLTTGDGDGETMERWPEKLPMLGEAEKSEAEERLLETALSNFALLVIEPFEVDYLELAGGEGDRRTKFKRDEGETAFEETLVVP